MRIPAKLKESALGTRRGIGFWFFVNQRVSRRFCFNYTTRALPLAGHHFIGSILDSSNILKPRPFFGRKIIFMKPRSIRPFPLRPLLVVSFMMLIGMAYLLLPVIFPSMVINLKALHDGLLLRFQTLPILEFRMKALENSMKEGMNPWMNLFILLILVLFSEEETHYI